MAAQRLFILRAPAKDSASGCVLHVITSINRGGAENHLIELIRGQRAHGWRVAVAYLKGDGYWTDELSKLGADVHPLRLSRYGELAPCLRLRQLIRRLQTDVVHCHLPPAELYARLALTGLSHRPVFVITKHNDEPFYRGTGSRLLARWVARPARGIIAISDAVNRYWTVNLGPLRQQLLTVYYGIDPHPFSAVSEAKRDAIRATLGCPLGGWIIGTVARLVPQKALHVLLDAYAGYRKRALRPSRLVIVGTGPLREMLIAQASNLGISDHLFWAGFREDIPEVMAAFDLFTLTSAYEGFGLVLLEAMASARPILATRVSAIPEVVVHGVTGRMVDPGRVDQVTSALLELESDELRHKLGNAGKLRAEQMFAPPRMIGQTLGIYAKCLESPS